MADPQTTLEKINAIEERFDNGVMSPHDVEELLKYAKDGAETAKNEDHHIKAMTQTANKYFDNELCDRLAEAGTFAGNHGMKITLDGLGITVERPKIDAPQLTVRRRMGYLDLSEARINILLELCKELAQ